MQVSQSRQLQNIFSLPNMKTRSCNYHRESLNGTILYFLVIHLYVCISLFRFHLRIVEEDKS